MDPDQLPSEKPTDQNLRFSKQDITMFSVMYYTPFKFYPINSQDFSYKHAFLATANQDLHCFQNWIYHCKCFKPYVSIRLCACLPGLHSVTSNIDQDQTEPLLEHTVFAFGVLSFSFKLFDFV